MKLSQIIKNPTFDFIVLSYFLFLTIGLLHSAFTQWIFGEKFFINNCWTLLVLHAMFLGLFYLVDLMILEEIKNKFWHYLVYYFFVGSIGLVGVEWLINKNWHIHFLGQVFMFLFWAGIAVLPKVVLDKSWTEEQKHALFERLIVLYIAILFVGMLAYFMFQTFVVWKLTIILFYLILNIILLKQIFYLKV